MLEVRALAQATNVLRQAQDIRGGRPNAIIVLSMVGKTYRLTQDMKDAAGALELPLARTALTLKQIYATPPGRGPSSGNSGPAAARRPRTSKRCSARCCRTPARNRAGRRNRRPGRNGEGSMADRRPLVAGLKPAAEVDPGVEKHFVYGPKAEAKEPAKAPPAEPREKNGANPVGRAP